MPPHWCELRPVGAVCGWAARLCAQRADDWGEQDLGEKLLRVDWQTHATAQIYMHFFFAHHSFLRRKRIYVALASMFLAAKVEECAAPYARRLSTVSQSVNTSVRPSVRPSVGCASS